MERKDHKEKKWDTSFPHALYHISTSGGAVAVATAFTHPLGPYHPSDDLEIGVPSIAVNLIPVTILACFHVLLQHSYLHVGRYFC